MKKIFIVFFLLLCITATSQTFPKKVVDSLTAIALSHKCNHPVVLNRDSVLQLLFQTPSAADRISMFYDIVSKYEVLTPEASLYYHKYILEGAKKRGDKVLEAVVMAELGFITSRNGNTVEGLKMIYESLEKAEATGNAQVIGIAYNNLGNCYPNNKKISREYWLKALNYAQKGNDYLFVCFNLGNLAASLRSINKDSALAYYLESYRLAVNKNIEVVIPNTLLALSWFDDKENSLQYYRQAGLMPFTGRNIGMKNNISSNKAYYYLQTKIMDSAFYYASQVYNTTRTANLTTQLGALNLMVAYYGSIHQSDSTLSYLTRYYKLKDSLSGNKVVEQAQTMAFNDMQRQKELAAQKTAFQNRMIVYFLCVVAVLLMGLAFIFWRSKSKEQQAKKIVEQQNDKLEQTLVILKTTQSQLVQSEKMASLGELTAGIAHEIQNPLNFVNNFSEVNKELLVEMDMEIDKGNFTEVKSIAKDIIDNEDKINHHGKRADAIVKGMLQHSRSSSGVKEPSDINALVDEYLRLAYHGLRAKDKSFNAAMKTDFDPSVGKIDVLPQDLGRVVLNLITNAFYAVNDRKKKMEPGYEPTITVSTQKLENKVMINVRDNGMGIPQRVQEKIFQPFFTTKPTGEGTGLGLSMSYDIIVKGHGGKLTVSTKEGEFALFSIILPT